MDCGPDFSLNIPYSVRIAKKGIKKIQWQYTTGKSDKKGIEKKNKPYIRDYLHIQGAGSKGVTPASSHSANTSRLYKHNNNDNYNDNDTDNDNDNDNDRDNDDNDEDEVTRGESHCPAEIETRAILQLYL